VAEVEYGRHRVRGLVPRVGDLDRCHEGPVAELGRRRDRDADVPCRRGTGENEEGEEESRHATGEANRHGGGRLAQRGHEEQRCPAGAHRQTTRAPPRRLLQVAASKAWRPQWPASPEASSPRTIVSVSGSSANVTG